MARRKFNRNRKKFNRKKFSRRRRSGKGEFGVRYMKLRRFISNTTSAAGLLQYDINVRDPSGCSDWSNCSALFDEYRVCAVKLQWTPRLPNDYSTLNTYTPMGLCFDVNSTSTSGFTQMTDLMQYENFSAKNVYLPWKKYIKVPKVSTGGSLIGWCTTTTPDTHGCLSVFYTSSMVSTLVGYTFITYYVKFRARH